MVAAVLGVVDLMSDTGLSAWIGDLVAPAVEVFASSPALVVIACSVLSTLLMMALVNYLVFAALAMALLSAVPMDPLCILFPICMSGMVFILPPQNVPMLAAEGLSAGRMLFKDTRPAAYALRRMLPGRLHCLHPLVEHARLHLLIHTARLSGFHLWTGGFLLCGPRSGVHVKLPQI